MTSTSVIDRLIPEALVLEILKKPIRTFLATYGSTPFVLIRIEEMGVELLSGLGSNIIKKTSGSPSLEALSYETVEGGASEDSKSFGSKSEMYQNLDMMALRSRIKDNQHLIIPLRKREPENPYGPRITVGRSRNMDIVLRHSSISKFHGWFEIKERTGMVCVTDAGSKNGTAMNEDMITANEMMRLSSGDKIRFGAVTMVFFFPETLWRLLHEEHD